MQTELIRKIRNRLGINPGSKSTLVTKEDLLRYAQLVHQENQQYQEILQPRLSE